MVGEKEKKVRILSFSLFLLFFFIDALSWRFPFSIYMRNSKSFPFNMFIAV